MHDHVLHTTCFYWVADSYTCSATTPRQGNPVRWLLYFIPNAINSLTGSTKKYKPRYFKLIILIKKKNLVYFGGNVNLLK